MSYSQKRFFTGAIIAIFVVGFFFAGYAISGVAWSHKVCTVNAKEYSLLGAGKNQTGDYIKTTCGDFRFARWPAPGNGLQDTIEVGKTYDLGVNGMDLLLSDPTIVSATEVEK